MSGTFYTECRPCYTGESSYSVLIKICGVGYIDGETFAGFINDPNGNPLSNPVTISIVDPNYRKINATFSGPFNTPGEYQWSVRRTDDGSNLVVGWGIFDVTQMPFPVP